MSLRLSASACRLIPRVLPYEWLARAVDPVLRPMMELLEARRLLSIANSTFESGDGNLVHASGIDWDNVPNRVVQIDKTSGQSDDSYKGSKEDEASPTLDSGSIPNNKSDLTRFYMANEVVTTGSGASAIDNQIIYLAWERENTLGTANIDFEFNQSQTASANGVTPLRTAGDILVTFDFSSGGNHVDLGLRKWTGSAWGAAADLDAGGFAEGSVNSGNITDPINPGAPRTLADKTFGECAVNLTAAGVFNANECLHFGGVFAKSRSSDSFSSAMKDFIAPKQISITTCPDITVLKTADAPIISTGDTAGFTVTVSNVGTGTARGATLNDPLPAGVSWTLDAASITAGFFINNNTLKLGPVDIAGATSRTAHITGVTDAADCGTLTNTATVAATNEPEDDTLNNTSTATITVNCPNVTVTKVADNDTISTGDQAGFTITVSNTGAGKAYNVTLTDTLPSGVSWSISPASAGFSINNGILSGSFSSLDSGASKSVHIVGTTDAADCGTITNTVMVGASNEDSDESGDNSATANITVNCPDLAITKVADNATINTGDQAGFTITITNVGVGNAYSVTMSDTLPSGVSWSISPASTGFSISNGVLSGALGTMAPNATKSVHIIGTTDAADCGTLTNTATATAPNEDSDHTDNNSATATITVNCPDVTVTKVADLATISAGDQAGFTMVLTNNGPGVAYNATMMDTLPTGVTWMISPASTGFSISNGVLSGSFATLAVGASKSVHIVATTTVANIGTIPNTVTVAAVNEATDHQDNNSAQASITVDGADVHITKAASADNVTHDEPFTYTLTVTNTTNGSAKNVTVTDTLDSMLVINSYSINGGPAVTGPFGSQTLVINVGTLAANDNAAGGPDTAVVTINVTPELECGHIHNMAHVSASNEPAAMQNDNDSNDVEVTVFPDANGATATIIGNPFEATDGNLTAAASGATVDWKSFFDITGGMKIDIETTTGNKDSSFGQGAKEDTAVPSVVTGSIPNNKSDLLRFYVATDKVAMHDYLYLGWVRANTLGTANMDFEFNQSTTISSNKVTPVRTVGDLLITFDFANGGNTVNLGLRKWLASGQWGAAKNLNDSGLAVGSVNDAAFGSGAINDPIVNKPLAADTFGEAAIDLTGVFAGTIPPGECVHFATAFLKSRSSASFSAEMKDFIPPISVGVVVFNPGDTTAAAPFVTNTTSIAGTIFNGSGTSGLMVNSGSSLSAWSLLNSSKQDEILA